MVRRTLLGSQKILSVNSFEEYLFISSLQWKHFLLNNFLWSGKFPCMLKILHGTINARESFLFKSARESFFFLFKSVCYLLYIYRSCK